MKTSKFLLSIVITVMLLITGCSKKKNSDPAINYQLQTTNRLADVSGIQSTSILWTSGYCSAFRIEFEAKNNNQVIQRASQDSLKIDLFSAITNLEKLTLSPGTYTETEFEVELNPTGTYAAIELNGQYSTAGLNGTPIVFRSIDFLELLNAKNIIDVAENTNYKAIITIDLSLITRNVTESMLDGAVRTNGTILISSTVNADIYNIIENNLQASGDVIFEKN
jgi:hypothetical protein